MDQMLVKMFMITTSVFWTKSLYKGGTSCSWPMGPKPRDEMATISSTVSNDFTVENVPIKC